MKTPPPASVPRALSPAWRRGRRGGGHRRAGVEGTWIATAGPRTFHGLVGAGAPGPAATNAGLVVDVNDGGDVIGQGTWSAQRSRRDFRQVVGARGDGGSYGTFEADLPGFKGKTWKHVRGTKTAQSPATGDGRRTGSLVPEGPAS
jgi:hypothetical protein